MGATCAIARLQYAKVPEGSGNEILEDYQKTQANVNLSYSPLQSTLIQPQVFKDRSKNAINENGNRKMIGRQEDEG